MKKCIHFLRAFSASAEGEKEFSSSRMPRTRKKFVSSILEAYRRRMQTVDQLILACFVLGMSPRKASAALVSVLGERVSANDRQ